MFTDRPARRTGFRHWTRLGLAAALFFGGSWTAEAQNYGTDARRMGMGGIGERSNLAWDMVPSATPYHSIPVPIGLFQLFGEIDALNPTSSAFNPSLLMSYASNPLHYGLNRGGGSLEQSFITDIVNAGLSMDLNAYRGFIPKSPSVSARGLDSPRFGKTFWLFDNGYMFQGLHLSAGPYLSLGTTVDFDENLINLLASNSDTYLPNTSFTIENATDTQVALAFTGGYRMKLPLPGGATSRDGIYLAANYNQLYGLRYEDIDAVVQLDTDAAGLLATNSPVVVDRLYSTSGKGRSIDLAAAVVVGGWDFTAAVEGLGNHMDWRDLGQKRHTLTSVTSGGTWSTLDVPAPSGTLRIDLPVRYSGGATFDAGPWAAGVDVAHGLEDLELRGGVEVSLGPIDFRGGGRRIRNVWNPTFGLGLNVTRGFGFDVAMVQMVNNLEGSREEAIAVSLRLTPEQ